MLSSQDVPKWDPSSSNTWEGNQKRSFIKITVLHFDQRLISKVNVKYIKNKKDRIKENLNSIQMHFYKLLDCQE